MAKLNKLGVKNSLWNNIRANRGSGRKPTPEMLRQERKIRSEYADGGPVYNWIPPNYPRVGARNEHGGWLDQYEYGGSIEDQRIPTPAQYEFGLKYADNNSPTLTTNQMGTPRAYAHGATVFTKQTTPAWVAGTPTPTTTQREIAFNRSFSPGTAVPYPEVKIPANAYTPASPSVLQGYNPYEGPMRLHAPDTTRMANGGRVTEKYKKRVGIPYAISPGVSNAGMYVGPTTQRGITFADGGPIYVTDKRDPLLKAFKDSLNVYNLSRRNEILFRQDPFDPRLPKYNEEAAKLAEKTNLKPDKYISGFDSTTFRITPATKIEDSPGYHFMDTPWIATFKKPVNTVIYKPKTDVEKIPKRELKNVDVDIKAEPISVSNVSSSKLPATYLDSSGIYSPTPQTPPGYTEEQLLKMGYRAPRKKKNGGWLDNL